MQALGYLILLTMGIIQVAAVGSYFNAYLDWHWLISYPLALVVASIPIVGPLVGIFGAIEVWNWGLIASISLFFWPYILLGVLSLINAVASGRRVVTAPPIAISKSSENNKNKAA